MLAKLLSASTLTAGLLAPLVLVPAPAQADTPTCVSRAEFRAVKRGWSIQRVVNRFDVRGRQEYVDSGDPEYDIPAFQSRDYRACPDHSSVWLSFEKESGDVWRVTSKSAYWGS
jgi:hypothetical protein